MLETVEIVMKLGLTGAAILSVIILGLVVKYLYNSQDRKTVQQAKTIAILNELRIKDMMTYASKLEEKNDQYYKLLIDLVPKLEVLNATVCHECKEDMGDG